MPGLPVESDRRSRDAFWAVILANSCCAGSDTAVIAEGIMTSLGYEPLLIDDITALCTTSLTRLDEIGGGRSPVEMLDIYRQVLRG